MFIPEVDALLTIELPQERVRARIVHVRNEDALIAELVSTPVSKSHNFKLNDMVSCLREKTMLGEVWRAVDPAVEEAKQRLLAQMKEDKERAAREAAELSELASRQTKQKEKRRAVKARKQSSDDRKQHSRNGSGGASSRPGSGGKSQQRTPAPARQSRPRGRGQ